LGPTRFERCEHRVEGETHVGPHANLAEVWSHIGKASIPQLDAALPGARIPGAESGVPEVRRVGLDAQQWGVGSRPRVARVVTDLSPALASEDDDDGAIEIKDEAGTVIWQMDEVR